ANLRTAPIASASPVHHARRDWKDGAGTWSRAHPRVSRAESEHAGTTTRPPCSTSEPGKRCPCPQAASTITRSTERCLPLDRVVARSLRRMLLPEHAPEYGFDFAQWTLVEQHSSGEGAPAASSVVAARSGPRAASRCAPTRDAGSN